MNGPFDLGKIESLEAQFPRVDVRAQAAQVREWHRRKPGEVRDPNAVLVDRCRKAHERLEQADRQQSLLAPMPAEERQRYAALHVRLYAELVTEKLTPRRLANRLERARQDGYPKLNADVVTLLLALGDTWPGESGLDPTPGRGTTPAAQGGA